MVLSTVIQTRSPSATLLKPSSVVSLPIVSPMVLAVAVPIQTVVLAVALAQSLDEACLADVALDRAVAVPEAG